MQLEIYVPTMNAATYDPKILNTNQAVKVLDHFQYGNAGYLGMCQIALEGSDADIIAYLHCDLDILEPCWEQRVLAEFSSPDVMAVGFGGATELAHEDIYKLPYDYRQLARAGYRSNDVEAEAHGIRIAGTCNVAVLDSFALFIRREHLLAAGGWPIDRYEPSHCGDTWLCMTAARMGKRVRVVGVSCQHFSGGRGTAYGKWLQRIGKTDEEMHRKNHRTLYEEGRGTLPLRIKP